MIKLYDTVTEKIKEIKIPKEGVFNIYLCGPTTYNKVHIGNIRPVIFTELFINYLNFKKIKWFYVQNITDIDDKVVDEFKKKVTNETFDKFVIKQKKNYKYLLDLIIKNKPNLMPTVLENMDDILFFLDKMEKEKIIYKNSGNYFFSFNSSKGNYGEISKQNTNDLVANEKSLKIQKYDKRDFSVWKNIQNEDFKFRYKNTTGRPGWHTECSAFIDKIFESNTIDLHIGGTDLKFPHHENENIQFFELNNRKISKTWFHVGQLNINGKKMSKSLNNFIYADDFIKNHGINQLKFLYYFSSFNKPISFNNEFLKFVNMEVKKIENLIKKLNIKINNYRELDYDSLLKSDYFNEFILSIENNLNMPNAMAALSKLMKDLNKNLENKSELVKEFIFILNFIGFVHE